MDVRSRGWCFTDFSLKEKEIETIDCTYKVFGREVCPDTKKPHLQGYLYFSEAKSFRRIKSLMPAGAHIEKARGNPDQNIQYCIKEGDFLEFGVRPKKGRRNDLNKVRDLLLEGASVTDMIMEGCTSYQGLKGAELMQKYIFKTPESKRHFVVYNVDTLILDDIYDISPSCFLATGDVGFNGYDGQDICVMDVPYFDVKMLAKMPYRVNVKYGVRVLTSPILIECRYDKFDHIAHNAKLISELKIYNNAIQEKRSTQRTLDSKVETK